MHRYEEDDIDALAKLIFAGLIMFAVIASVVVGLWAWWAV